jgi:DNA-directed DNA polymerase III PolC
MYLNCKTYFSFRYGTLATEELVKTGAENGATTLALTNINNTCDIWDFVKFCREQQIKPIAGVEIRNENDCLYILLAVNNKGYGEINRFVSEHLQSLTPSPSPKGEGKESRNILFPLKPLKHNDVIVIYPFSKERMNHLDTNEYIGIKPSEINKLYGLDLTGIKEKLVMLQPVSFNGKIQYNLHRLLRAIDKNILLSKQEPAHCASPDEQFIPPAKLMEAFRQYPFIITNTLQLAEHCNIEMDFHSDKNKKTYSATKEDDRVLLEKLANEGALQRFGEYNREAIQRVKKELKIINDLGFNAYFLITWDIIRYAQIRGFYYVGRGSGANSIVAYCLQITDVDPIELDLYFERFLNPHRTSPPDFDIDFSWKDRDEVIDYIFKRYGKEQVALLGMYSTFQYRATIRELGKVFGLPKAEIDALADNRASRLNEDKIQRQIKQYGNLLVNFPNHLSIHPGGMLISEESIYQYAAVDLPPKGFATAQLDMFVAENVGLYKLDILSQRGLGHIKEALRLIRQNRQKDINIHDIDAFKKDRQVAAQIKSADTIGCFYIESPAMRQLLKKLECDDYITLVAASSIIRPGVAQSGMMREYIYRYHNPDKFKYLHPKMEELLQETFGVMVFQEDVIKVAHHFAGLDMGEADILRRAMSGKYRGNKEMERIEQKFFVNCKERGHPDNISKEVWRQIESFGGYSFSKAHSASFAVESYQSLYLKTYFPKEFMVAVINNFGGFYSTELYFHELKKAGARLYPPCMNNSHELTGIKGNDVYVGLTHIKGLGNDLLNRILAERNRGGSFLGLYDFIERSRIGAEQLNTLVRVGTFGFTGKTKKELLWEANFLQKKTKAKSGSAALFSEQPANFKLPQLSQTPKEDMLDEIELLGFTIGNVFDLVTIPEGTIPARDLQLHLGATVSLLGYLVTTKQVGTKNNDFMYFGTFIDPNGDWLDTVHFPDSALQYPMQGGGFYLLTGKVVEDFGVFNVEVGWMRKVGVKHA